MSIDILPAQIPLDASAHFSTALMPYLRALIRQYQESLVTEDQGRVEALNRATIAQHGGLSDAHKWLTKPLRDFRERQANEATSAVEADVPTQAKQNLAGFIPKRRVLLLGSGMVARPVIEELSKRKDVHLVVGECLLNVPVSSHLVQLAVSASNNVSEVPFIKEFEDVIFKQVDLVDITVVDGLINDADAVVRYSSDKSSPCDVADFLHCVTSLLPAPFHPTVAKLCINHKKHMVTASYISPAMRELHEALVTFHIFHSSSLTTCNAVL